MARMVKSGTYCIMHFTIAIAVAYAISGDWLIALSIGTIEPLVQTVSYTLHELAWDRWREKQMKKVNSTSNFTLPSAA